MKKTAFVFLSLCLILNSTGGFAFGVENESERPKRADAPFEIKVTQWGPTPAEIAAAKERAEKSAAVAEKLKGTKYRLVGFRYIEQEPDKKTLPSIPPKRYQAVFYDYTNQRSIVAESDFAGKEQVTVSEEILDPGASSSEVKAAFDIVKKDSQFLAYSSKDQLEYYEPMPPTTNLKGERLVNVGIRNTSNGKNEIVSVSFKNTKVVRYENAAPPMAKAEAETCGIPNANQGSTADGTEGQYQVSVSQGGVTLWEMLVIRPASSSGQPYERSGIEVRDVKYKGKSVLKRGHLPILNVKYNGTADCGPYRDWQYAEGFFNAPAEGATDPLPGFRILADGKVATTVVETGNDLGNFQGIAAYRQDVGFGNELVLVTEMNAGWYRYIMEWRFAYDGTIRPRYGFASIDNRCVCFSRTHHAYWRLDFDIVGPNNKVFKLERGRKYITQVTEEAEIFRDNSIWRRFMIQNSNGDEAYQIVPNLIDGSAANLRGELVDTFAKGDLWFLRYKETNGAVAEINDPNVMPDVSAHLSQWITGESLVDRDVVVWYAAHQTRSDASSRSAESTAVLTGKHIIGPDLRPVRW